MKILHLYKDYFPVIGGIENHVKLIAEAQAARGHDVTVLVTSLTRTPRVESINGVRIIYASRWFNLSSAPFSVQLFRELSDIDADVAHLHSPYPFGEFAQLLFGRARATVLTYHSDIVRQKVMGALYTPLLHRFLSRVDTIIATSPNYINSSPVLQQWRDKCVVVPLAIPTPPPFSGTIKQSSGNQLLFVGRLRYYKGLNYLLEALKSLPRAHLTIVGTGPKESEWKALAASLGIMGQLTWAGEISDAELDAYYQACDIFVLPCSERSEAFGAVQLEAMVQGKPVVSCDVNTGVAWVNQDEITGLVVPPKNPSALAKAIQHLMNDAEPRSRLGEAGARRVRSEFTIDKIVVRIDDVYKRALENAAHSPEGSVK